MYIIRELICFTDLIQIRPDIDFEPDLGPNCLQRLSTDNTSGKELIKDYQQMTYVSSRHLRVNISLPTSAVW